MKHQNLTDAQILVLLDKHGKALASNQGKFFLENIVTRHLEPLASTQYSAALREAWEKARKR